VLDAVKQAKNQPGASNLCHDKPPPGFTFCNLKTERAEADLTRKTFPTLSVERATPFSMTCIPCAQSHARAQTKAAELLQLIRTRVA